MVIVDGAGSVIRSWGDPDDTYFLRSAAKPFQAFVSQANGADLSMRQLALASASHSGEPVHIAIVAQMLAEVGLGPEHLLCPPDRPMSQAANRRLNREDRLLHNCSGKHAAMLRACVASGWSLGYTDPDHPLQTQILEVVAEVSSVDPSPTGIDGCGVPTLRTTTLGLARAFARLATDSAFAEVAAAMHRYPYLTAGTGRAEPAIAVAVNAVVKGGAKGCLGVAVMGQFGIASKAADGLMEPATIGVIEALDRLGLITPAIDVALAEYRHPVVMGGGAIVGHWESALS